MRRPGIGCYVARPFLPLTLVAAGAAAYPLMGRPSNSWANPLSRERALGIKLTFAVKLFPEAQWRFVFPPRFPVAPSFLDVRARRLVVEGPTWVVGCGRSAMAENLQ